MATLFNTKISATYEGLFKTIDNAAITASLKELTDGSGNQSGLYVNNAGDFKVSNILEWGSLKDTGTGVVVTRYVTSIDGIENFDNNTSLPTSAAVKLYVDTKFATSDTLQEVLSFGNTTGGNDIAVSASDDITFTDTSKAIFGAGSDLQIYHESSNISYIKHNASSDFRIQTSSTGYIKLMAELENMAVFIPNSAVELYFDNSKKLATTNTGVDVTGNLVVSGTITGSGGSFLPLAGGTMTGNIVLNDNVKSIYGTSSDGLEIYHDGSNSLIADTGKGLLNIRSNEVRVTNAAGNEIQLQAIENSSVKLYFDGSEKFYTTNTGVQVIGALSTTTNVSVGANATFVDNGKALFGAGSDLQIYHNGSHSYIQDTGTGELRITASTFSLRNSGDTELLMTAYENGAVNLYFDGTKRIETVTAGAKVTGNLEVTGTITGSGGSFLPLIGGNMTGNTTHNDSVRSQFGDGNDLQIYHDSNNSFIEETTGVGSLYLRANSLNLTSFTGTENYITMAVNGSVTLFDNNVSKLTTTSTGINVLGNASLQAGFSIPDSQYGKFGTGDDIIIGHDSTNSIIRSSTGDLYIDQAAVTKSMIFRVSDANALDVTALTISRNGDLTTGRDVTIAGDLTVNGTTTTVNSQTLAVVDPLIQLAKDNTANSLDIGLYGDYNDGTGRYLGLFSDASDGNKFKLFKGTTVEPTTTVNIGGAGYVAADLEVAGLESSSFISTGAVRGTFFVSTTDGGLSINGMTLTRIAANSAIRVSNGLETLGLLRSYAGLNVGTTSTFGGNITANGYLTLTGQATPQIFMDSNTAGTPSWTMIARNDGYFLIGRSGVSNDFYLDSSGDATFSGSITAGTITTGTYYKSSGGSNVIGTGSSGEVLLRPTAWNLSTAQSSFTTTLATIGTNLTVSGTINSGYITGTGFTDGIVTWNGAQFNRSGAAIEFQFQGDANSLVKFGANGSNPVSINANTGIITATGATFTGNLIAGSTFKVNGNTTDATLELFCNTGSWSFINKQSSRYLELFDSDGTGTVMTIDTNGNMGIGVVPTNKLHVKDETPYGGLTLQGNNAPCVTFDDTSDAAVSQIYAQNGGILRLVADVNNAVAGSSLELHVDGTERFRIFENGNIQMGNVTTSVTNPQSWGQIFQVRNAGANGAAISLTDSNNEYNIATYGGQFLISTGAEERLVINNAGEVGINVNNPLFELCIGNGATPNRNLMEFAVSNTDAGTNILQNYNRATAAYTPMNLAAKFLTIGTGTAATQRILLDENGRFGLSGSNTITAPTYLMQINMQAEGSPLNYLNGTALNFGNNGFTSIHSNPTANNTIEAGLRLQNNNNDIGAYSPLIAFSARSSSNTYNHTYAAIYGIKTAGGADTNWSRGDIVFATSSGTGANERMRLDKDGQLGIGTINFQTDGRPQKPLHIEAGSGSQVLISAADDAVGTTAGIVFRAEGGEANGLARIKGGIFFERIAGTYGNGDLHLANDGAANNNEVTAANKRLSIKSDGTIAIIGEITDQAGARTFTKGGSMQNSVAYTFDIAVPNDSGMGTVHHVDAMMTHYDTTYGCVLNCYAYTRGTGVNTQTDLVNQSNTNAGGWTVTKPNNTTLRITKTAGTYPGTGFYQIKVLTKTP
jgi:hypothetical protein